MERIAICLALVLTTGCHGYLFGGRTTDEDKELNNFAEARQRAATYYDGGDYERAAAQYSAALEFRPDHVPSRLGYGYSLLATTRPSNLVKAKREFEDLGTRDDLKVEVKRVHGLALTCRGLAARYQRRAVENRKRDRRSEAVADTARSREYATESMGHFKRVIEIDDKLAEKTPLSPLRVSASLTPDAHLGIAHCEILLIDLSASTKKGKAKNMRRLQNAEDRLQKFATIAQNARRFWELRREKVLRTDPLEDEDLTGSRVIAPGEKERYEARIANTIRQEVDVRRIMLETLLFMNNHERAIAEATKILELDPAANDVLFRRAHAYAWRKNYKAALADLKEYRRRQDLSRLTDEVVRVNKRIRTWERLAAEQEKRG